MCIDALQSRESFGGHVRASSIDAGREAFGKTTGPVVAPGNSTGASRGCTRTARLRRIKLRRGANK